MARYERVGGYFCLHLLEEVNGTGKEGIYIGQGI
jgi:hypothetical protein